MLAHPALPGRKIPPAGKDQSGPPMLSGRVPVCFLRDFFGVFFHFLTARFFAMTPAWLLRAQRPRAVIGEDRVHVVAGFRVRRHPVIFVHGA
jgi:hypothetical protein